MKINSINWSCFLLIVIILLHNFQLRECVLRLVLLFFFPLLSIIARITIVDVSIRPQISDTIIFHKHKPRRHSRAPPRATKTFRRDSNAIRPHWAGTRNLPSAFPVLDDRTGNTLANTLQCLSSTIFIYLHINMYYAYFRLTTFVWFFMSTRFGTWICILLAEREVLKYVLS